MSLIGRMFSNEVFKTPIETRTWKVFGKGLENTFFKKGFPKIKGVSKNKNFWCGSKEAGHLRTGVYAVINEDSSTTLTQLTRKKAIFRGAQEFKTKSFLLSFFSKKRPINTISVNGYNWICDYSSFCVILVLKIPLKNDNGMKIAC